MTTRRTFAPTRWAADDDHCLGYRYVNGFDSNGKATMRQIALTEEDVLYPLAGDFIVRNMAHNEDASYLWLCFKSAVATQPGRRAFHYMRTDFGVEGIKPLCVDAIVFDGVTKWNDNWETVPVVEIGATPLLAIEVTSPVTRDNDIGIKFDLYKRCGVPFYVIIDRQWDEDGLDLSLYAYQLGPDGYEEVEADNQGRIWLEPVKLWLSLAEGKAVCTDGDSRRIPTALEAINGRRAAEEATRQAKEATRQAKEATRRAEERADSEAHARQQAEATIRALEEKLRRLNDP